MNGILKDKVMRVRYNGKIHNMLKSQGNGDFWVVED